MNCFTLASWQPAQQFGQQSSATPQPLGKRIMAGMWPLGLLALTVGTVGLWLVMKRMGNSSLSASEPLATVPEAHEAATAPDPTPDEVRRVMKFMGRQSGKVRQRKQNTETVQTASNTSPTA